MKISANVAAAKGKAMTQLEIWLIGALVLVHLLGAWLMYAMAEEGYGYHIVNDRKALWGTTCFLLWEGIVLWTVFTMKETRK